MVLLGLGTAAPLCAQTQSPDYVDGSIYLKVADTSGVILAPYTNNIPALNLIISTFSIDSIYRPFKLNDPALQRIYRLEFSALALVDLLVSQLQLLPFVEYVEKVPLMRPAYDPNDIQPSQWHLNKIQARGAWDLARGDSNVVIAIIDNAFLLTHEDLAPVLWRNPGEIPGNFWDDDLNGYADDVHGADLADFDGNPNPPAGNLTGTGWDHGTHCAGIAAGATDNGTGIASIGFGVRLMPVKVSSNTTNGDVFTRAFEGIDYAVSNGAKIVSMSWGSTGNSPTGNLILTIAATRNVVLVAAGGNTNTTTPFYPASYIQCIGVGATDMQDHKSSFSNYGGNVDVMAPGSDILSTLVTGTNAYGTLSGTSMACPLVAGLAGLVWSASPTLTPAQVRQAIESTCIPIDSLNPNYAGQLGFGRIDANLAVLSVTVGRTPPQPELHLHASPNPVQDRLQIRLPDANSYHLSLLDLQGRTLHTWLGTGPSTELDMSAFPAGCYLLRVQDPHGNAQAVLRVLKP
jgi:serine protease